MWAELKYRGEVEKLLELVVGKACAMVQRNGSSWHVPEVARTLLWLGRGTWWGAQLALRFEEPRCQSEEGHVYGMLEAWGF